jgi:hypothetical protein
MRREPALAQGSRNGFQIDVASHHDREQAQYVVMATSPVSSSDFRLERTSGQPSERAVMNWDSGRSIS